MRSSGCSIQVKKASLSELEYVQSKLTPEVPYEPAPPDPLVTRFVAIRHGQVVGFVELVRHPPEHAPFVGFWLFSLNVLNPLYRGIGVGEALTRRVIDLARDDGAKELWLVVNEDNLPAIKLYQKFGFKTATVIGLDEQLKEEAMKTGRQRITMMKPLAERDGRNA